MIDEELWCGECGSKLISTMHIQQKFQYGKGADAVQLEVTLPLRHCDSCHFEFFDHESETIQDEYVRQYLQQNPRT